MTRPTITTRPIGAEAEPLVTIDGFASADADALRAAAIATPFAPADQHYPGIRAALPPGYLHGRLPLIASALGRSFGRFRRIHVIDASFSIVTTSPTALSVKQRLPHVDAFGRTRIALIHYLSPEGGDGTAFYRHRATGYETIDEDRATTYFETLDRELREGDAPAGYIAGDTALFAQTERVEARYDRALLYRSCLLHSGAIAPDAMLPADPTAGRPSPPSWPSNNPSQRRGRDNRDRTPPHGCRGAGCRRTA